MKRAFTLIELLVVIAIIAILAAILFPVFAQAKEAAKKTATLSQDKQVGTAAQIYLSDTDDTMPLSGSFNTQTKVWRVGYPVPDSVYNVIPAGWTASRGRDVSPRFEEEQLFVLNSLQPYIKSNGMYQAAGLPLYNIGYTKSTTRPQDPSQVGVTYNGMLHAYSGTGMAQPSRVPMFWGGLFKQNLLGGAFSQPQLNCQASESCRFNPSGPPGSTTGDPYGYTWYGVGTSGSVWLYGRSTPIVYADTHVKMHSFNGPIWPKYAENVNDNPFSSFSSEKGDPYWMTDCVAPGAAKGSAPFYPGFFRPDSEFTYTSRECDFGGG